MTPRGKPGWWPNQRMRTLSHAECRMFRRVNGRTFAGPVGQSKLSPHQVASAKYEVVHRVSVDQLTRHALIGNCRCPRGSHVEHIREDYAHSVLSRRRAGLLLLAGSGLFLGSVAVLLLVPRSDAAFGWFAYAPLAGTAFTAGFLLLDPINRSAIAVGIMGLVAGSWAAGFLAGGRAR